MTAAATVRLTELADRVIVMQARTVAITMSLKHLLHNKTEALRC